MNATTETKAPTPQGISALLRKAGFERAVISIRGGTSGYQVTKCRARAEAVKVRQYFTLGGTSLQRYRHELRRYAKAIEAAGYQTEVATYHLIVTARTALVQDTNSEGEDR
jgi:hypothetical protein